MAQSTQRPGASQRAGASTTRRPSPLDDLEGGSGIPALAGAEAWVRQNQTLAVAAAFAVGTFIGVMMRG